ncbi:Protein-methionine sulfoxide oxidase mical3a [Takifugu flavidus]|uniref:F-actin monooxygenase n=1 Tax=Takifugu flavidus TaxID=433684 RepID=A0A5C6PEA6_9TELE|nr:Protein-methionine sulfoxide oxidase mical3a [Takifugu flavidus]
MGDRSSGATGRDGANHSHVLFDNFVQASTCKGTLKSFQELCDHLDVKPTESRIFYHKLKSKLNYWKAKALWAKLDKRACQKEYKKGRACANSKCLIIGAGPCGLRTAIELALLGAKVVLLEKRDAFSRNNVLHLWPFAIQDLRGLGAKKFYGKFCAGAIDHISIRQLQLMLLKMALLLGIEIHVNVEFKGLVEPPEDQETESFRRKEFRGKLAIAITANFINRNTTAEAKVEEISGVAFIFNQKFFQDLREATGIDLENIVYYKDDTHYFVMTAKKQSLLEKGVILHDYADTELLLSRANVDQAALLSYAREAADFSTNHQLPTLDFAINHYGQPDVAMFDFTCMYASENAAMVRQRQGHNLLVALVGDSLLEPFWPMGTGIARGFLAAMDSGWMVRSWAQGKTPLEVLAERESIYRLLPQTTPENVNKNFSQYSLDPITRYPNVSLHFLKPSQVRHLYDTGESREIRMEIENVINSSTPKLARNAVQPCNVKPAIPESIARSSKLLSWCQRQTEGYRNVRVTDLTMSWKSGLALCALIDRYRPDLIDFESLDEKDYEQNNQLAFDVAEREFGISPCMTGKEMSSVVEPDKLSMVMYLSQFYEMFKDTVPPGDNHNLSPEEKAALIASTKSPISLLSKLGQSIAISRKRNPKDKKEKDVDSLGKRRKTSQSEEEEASRGVCDDRSSVPAVLSEKKMDSSNHNKVKVMATQLLAKFEENAPAPQAGLKRQGDSLPNLDHLFPPPLPQISMNEPARLAPVPAWRKRRTQQQEKLSIRYKEMIKCQTLPTRGEQWSFTQQEWIPLPLSDPEPIHIPSIQERAECLISRFKGKSDRPPKEGARPLLSDSHAPLYVLSIQERAEQLASQFEGKPVGLQHCVRMYTGGVSSLTQQITHQLKSLESPKPLLEKKDRSGIEELASSLAAAFVDVSSEQNRYPSVICRGSLRKEFPTNIGGSDVCFFCHKRVYVMERLSAEGKFFHRSCFKCEYCGTTLRLSSYAFDVEDGKFYCKPHYCYRVSGYAQRKRPAPSPPPVADQENQVPQAGMAAVDAPGRVTVAEAAPAIQLPASGSPFKCLALVAAPRRLAESVVVPLHSLRLPEVNGLQEPSLAKRLRGTPERIELENYRLSLQREEELEEVPEETLAEHNLSSVLDKVTDADLGSSSSESDMEDEQEEQDQEEEEEEAEQPPASPSDLGGVPWKEAVELHAKLRGSHGAEGEAGADTVSGDGELEEEEDDEEEEEEDEEEEEEDSSEEGDYCPWDRELQSGLWLEKHLTDEEDIELCEEEEAEADSQDMEPGTEMDQEDIPSDAEAEARLHQSECADGHPEEDGTSESLRMSSSVEASITGPMPKEDVHSPAKAPELGTQMPLLKPPGGRFFPEPFLPDEATAERMTPSPSRVIKSPLNLSPVPARDPSPACSPTFPVAVPSTPPVSIPTSLSLSLTAKSPVERVADSPNLSPVKSPLNSPIRSQPTSLLESCTSKTPVYPQRSICPLTGNPLSPICSQSLPCQEPSSPLTSDSPVRTQPVPGLTSTPMNKAEDRKQPDDSSVEETPSKKTDIIEEFWLKSAEIRKSLGLTPLDRSSKILEKSVIKDPAPVKTQSPEVSKEQKSVLTGHAVIHRLNITLEGQVITPLVPAEPKSNSSDKKYLSSSSGLGLNGSSMASQTANSEGYNTSDSAMLTPPSSPPPPVPANQSPAVLRQKKHLVTWSNGAEKTPSELAKEPADRKLSPPPIKSPVSAPQRVSTPQADKEAAPVVVVMREKKKKPRPSEVRKSFVETVEEIPFADDVEESCDERMPDTSMNKYYTPPTSKPSRPPLHLALAMENGKPNIPVSPTSKTQTAIQFSPEAREIAEERIKAREQSVKSQALKDAMAKQLNKMREADTDKGVSPKVAWNVMPNPSGKSKNSAGPQKTSTTKGVDSKKAETLPERFFSSNKSLDSSVASSDGSTTSKSKKRSSLFSPRKNKKEKKAKNDSSRLSGAEETPPKHKSLWKAVFSGYKKDKKKKDEKSCPSTPSSSSTTQDSGKKKISPPGRSSDLKASQNLSFSEDSDLSFDDVLEKSSQKSKPSRHTDIFDLVSGMQQEAIKEEKLVRETRRELKEKKFAKERQKRREWEKRVERGKDDEKTYTEEELDAKLTRRVQRAIRRQAKQEELKRLHRAQIIQRQLEQVEEKQRQLEERGVAVEKALRGEAGMGKKDDPKLMQEWFKLVQEKNALVRYESELMIFARELELEDRQSRLQQELRERMAVEDHLKTEKELAKEKQILNEMLEVVEQRNDLVALLEEQRLQEKEEDKDLEAVMLSKGLGLNWV